MTSPDQTRSRGGEQLDDGIDDTLVSTGGSCGRRGKSRYCA
jgi:hypothetical protein